MRRLILAVAGAAALAAAAPAAAHAPAFDEREEAWVAAKTYELFVDFPEGPPVPTGAPRADVFLIAPVKERRPQDPGVDVGVPGPPFPIPRHDQVVSRRIPAREPADCYGAFVEPTPLGEASGAVRTRTDRGVELAYAARLGGRRFVPLTSAERIRAAEAAGLVLLDPRLGYGGRCWTGSPRHVR